MKTFKCLQIFCKHACSDFYKIWCATELTIFFSERETGQNTEDGYQLVSLFSNAMLLNGLKNEAIKVCLWTINCEIMNCSDEQKKLGTCVADKRKRLDFWTKEE